MTGTPAGASVDDASLELSPPTMSSLMADAMASVSRVACTHRSAAETTSAHWLHHMPIPHAMRLRALAWSPPTQG